jgi:uncharacterized protein with FMN-binding domain
VAPKDKSRAGRKISNNLVAVSSAAVLAVYTAGYLRTKPAADRFEVAAAQRRANVPAPASAAAAPALPPQATREVAAVPQPPSPRAANRPVVAESPVAPATPETAPEPAPSAAPAPEPEPLATIETAPAITPATTPTESEGAPAAAAPQAPPRGPYADGTYTGWGYSRHGDIEATVIVEEGRIVSALISKCQTRYPCAGVVDHLPGQVLSRQRAKVDFVSGATQSSYAFEDAVAQALAKAK